MKFRMVSAGDCQLFAINLEHEIFKRMGLEPGRPVGTEWV